MATTIETEARKMTEEEADDLLRMCRHLTNGYPGNLDFYADCIKNFIGDLDNPEEEE